MQWARKKKILATVITMMQNFKGSISLMLNILQCGSDGEACRSQEELFELCSAILRHLQNDRELSQRNPRIEDCPNETRIEGQSNNWNPLGTPNTPSEFVTGISSQKADNRTSITTLQQSARQFEFEQELQASGPYRKAKRDTVDFSFRSSVALSHAWSALSECSLSDISVVSVIALPISLNDINNAYHYGNKPLLLENSTEIANGQREATYTDFRTAVYTSYEGKASLPTPGVSNSTWPLFRATPSPATTQNTVADGSKFLREYKLVVIGGYGSGKSGIAMQLTQSYFVNEYDLTVEDSHRKKCLIDNNVVLLDVLDTAGQEEYSAMREQYMRTGEGFLIVYSITSRKNFGEVLTLQQQLLRVKDRDYRPMILVGNHYDREDEREVSVKEGQKLARQFGCKFMEVSLKTRGNIEQAFYDLVRDINRFEMAEHAKVVAEEEQNKAEEKRKDAELVVRAGPFSRLYKAQPKWNERDPVLGIIEEV